NGSATLPRGFRFHHEEGPKTPEPVSVNETRQPSPPRQRFKVRRRNASNLQAPTAQFLASVAAADVPIPTIEIPQMHLGDSEMVDREEIETNIHLLGPQPYPFRFASPPKTPLPTLSMDDVVSRRPDWSMGTPSPAAEDYFQRPTSSHSNASSNSDDSFYSGSRASRPSEDGSCTSPESEAGDPFQFPISKGKGKAMSYEPVEQEPFEQRLPLNTNLRSKTRKNAIWTQAQSAHLWATYNVYLQDPTVTPFRIGASSIPPEGVCHRVAREAKRSWKGPKSTAPKVLTRVDSSSSRESEKSGSATPTGEAPKVYAQWPHASSASRNRLREMCKSNSTNVSRHRHLQSRSPTPFTKLNRLQTPEPPRKPVSAFNTKDIALSLTTSTAESMQPDGPLAKLGGDLLVTPTPATFSSLGEPLSVPKSHSLGNGINLERGPRRLGSPFVARTYGPSSSRSLHPYDSRPSPPRTQSDIQPLRSPVRFDHNHNTRSLNNTQKRRAAHDLEEELSPNGAIVRPSILNEQLFGTPFAQRRVRSRGFSLGDEALRHRAPGIFQPSPIVELVVPPKIQSPVPQPASSAAPQLLPAANLAPPRLGSPFSASGPSHTFPRRLTSDGSSTVRRSQFATMHQTRRSIESFDFGEGPSLQSRLEQLDQKLQQIREREAASRRQ
ncbi:uncharacterized protein LY89DRAFT_548687, partial [Mollisia scopiformis]